MATSSTRHRHDAPCRRQQRRDHVWVRQLRHGEFDILDTVFDGLSDTSRFHRFHRFHAATPRLLLPQVREHLAARDGRRHIAIAAFASRTPVGIARLIALDDYRGEIAVEVVDAWQRRGIGARLVRAITERGRFLGHTEIVADVLAENSAARGLLTSIFPKPNAATDGPEITFTVDLTTNDPAPATRAVA